MNDETHILDEAKSPPEALVWTMWCGETCIAFDDGTVAPEGFDFFTESAASKATCKRCRGCFERGEHDESEAQPMVAEVR